MMKEWINLPWVALVVVDAEIIVTTCFRAKSCDLSVDPFEFLVLLLPEPKRLSKLIESPNIDSCALS